MNRIDLQPGMYDLVTPDGKIVRILETYPDSLIVEGIIKGIGSNFIGFELPKDAVLFNLKSTLAQLGLHAELQSWDRDRRQGIAEWRVRLVALSPLAQAMLSLLSPGSFIGKLFANDDRRRVKKIHYFTRLFGRFDRHQRPLLSLGGPQDSHTLTIEEIEGRLVAFLALRPGRIEFQETIHGLLPTIGKALHSNLPMRSFVRLHQSWIAHASRTVETGRVLLCMTEPLHIRTLFARVVDDLLPPGIRHTAANILQPDTMASGDIYELYGSSSQEVHDIPLEFFTLEPFKEHVFFSDRDQLQDSLENNAVIFQAFDTAPSPKDHPAATFVVKGSQLHSLKEEDWICLNPPKQCFPGIAHDTRQAILAERYIEAQPSYPFLKAMEGEVITSQGVLLSRYFPSPLLKRMLLSYYVGFALRGIYFQIPSRSHGEFFSQEDRAMLIDLVSFGTPVFWADPRTNRLLQYLQRPNKTSGMFVPLNQKKQFLEATFFGLYGSNLLSGSCSEQLRSLFSGLLSMRHRLHHPQCNPKSSFALVTGGGPGVMEVGNQVANELGFLSCANIVNFGAHGVVHEQLQNSYIQAKMTYRLDHLVERQAEFYLDFPIFVMGGIGTDFEYSLEEVRHKVGARPNAPILLLGEPDYWRSKITSRFQSNLRSGTIRGSEWVSNSFFCVPSAEVALALYEEFFSGRLVLGKDGPTYPDGFVCYHH